MRSRAPPIELLWDGESSGQIRFPQFKLFNLAGIHELGRAEIQVVLQSQGGLVAVLRILLQQLLNHSPSLFAGVTLSQGLAMPCRPVGERGCP